MSSACESSTVVLTLRVEPAQLEELTERAGGRGKRSAYIRSLLFREPSVRSASHQAKQDAVGAPIVEPPAPHPEPARELIVLPPVGQPDAHGWHYRWNPRSATTGTLQFAKAGREWMEMDLIGASLDPQADGTARLYYTDRSLVRRAPEEGGG